jgi:hypothetical protein
MARTFLFLILAGVLGFQNLASAQTFKYEMAPYSSVGKVTGGKCLTHEDCVYGYLPKGQKFALLCLTKKQATGKRVGENHIPYNGLMCGCLPDVKLCGYAQAQEMYR